MDITNSKIDNDTMVIYRSNRIYIINISYINEMAIDLVGDLIIYTRYKDFEISKNFIYSIVHDNHKVVNGTVTEIHEYLKALIINKYYESTE